MKKSLFKYHSLIEDILKSKRSRLSKKDKEKLIEVQTKIIEQTKRKRINREDVKLIIDCILKLLLFGSNFM